MDYNNDRLPKFLCMSKDGESYVFTNKDTTMIFGVQRDGSSVIFASFEENELSKHNFIADIRNLKVPGEVSANFETLGVKYSYSWNGTEQEGEISSKEEVGENAPRSVEQKTSVGVKSDGISYQHCVKEKYTFNKKAKKSDKEKPLFEAKVEGKLNGMDNTSTLKYHKVLISRGGILALGGIEGSAGGKISVKGSIGFSTKVDEDNKRLSGASINVGGETLRLRGELGGGWSTEHSLYLVGADVSAALSYGLKVKAGNEIEASFPFLGVGGRLRVVDLEKGFQQTGNNYIISNFGR